LPPTPGCHFHRRRREIPIITMVKTRKMRITMRGDEREPPVIREPDEDE
jgi:hypothetical protein